MVTECSISEFALHCAVTDRRSYGATWAANVADRWNSCSGTRITVKQAYGALQGLVRRGQLSRVGKGMFA